MSSYNRELLEWMWFRLQWNQLYRRYWLGNDISRGFFSIDRHVREYFTHGDVDLCSTLMAIEQWELLNVPHLLWHGTPFIMVISKDLWHSHLSFSGQRYLQHPIKRKMCFSSLNFSEYWLREERNSSYLYHTYSYLNFKWKLLHMIIL